MKPHHILLILAIVFTALACNSKQTRIDMDALYIEQKIKYVK